MPDTSAMPAKPASPPLKRITQRMVRLMGIPAYRAAFSLSPITRISYPQRVRASLRGTGRPRRKASSRSEMDPRAGQAWKPGDLWEDRGPGETQAHGITPRAEIEVLDPIDGDVIEHQGREDLVDPQCRPQNTCQKRPEGPSEKSSRHHEGKHEGRGKVWSQEQRDGRGADPAEDELPLPSHIPDLDLRGDSDSQTAQHERNRLDHNLGQVVEAAEGALAITA